ncbi:kelch-like protein 38 isoform 2-T2 [Odontesthes bonariensis]|uniref:kelch-like protein 38 isoform X2 n=1 Tax=Odontesthes bonariensis TaxID=219752 RepID=UPI003F5884A5
MEPPAVEVRHYKDEEQSSNLLLQLNRLRHENILTDVLLCSELMGYLDDDSLCAEEEQVFETLVAWIHHDPISRRGAISDLFKKVRLRFIHPTYLFQFIANDPLIQSSTLCTELIESVRRLMFSVSTKCFEDSAVDFKPLWAAPRRCTYHDLLVVVGGRKNNEQTSREALVFDEKSQKWQRLAKLPVRLYKASYVALHSVLYVIGGLTTSIKHSQVSSAVYTLSLKTNQWRTVEPMLEPHFSHQSVSYLHFIFVLGGLGPDRRLTDSVERYNSMFNQWESMAPMPEAVLHPAVAATNQRIYMFGGEDAMQNPVRLIQVYHISRNTWSKMENRTVKNVSAPAVVTGEKIYIIGGYTRRMIAYDTKANRFIKCANLKERRMHHSATILDNKLYVTGGRYISGHDIIEDLDTFECYDPKTDVWSSKGSLPYKLFDHGFLTLTCVSKTWVE